MIEQKQHVRPMGVHRWFSKRQVRRRAVQQIEMDRYIDRARRLSDKERQAEGGRRQQDQTDAILEERQTGLRADEGCPDEEDLSAESKKEGQRAETPAPSRRVTSVRVSLP